MPVQWVSGEEMVQQVRLEGARHDYETALEFAMKAADEVRSWEDRVSRYQQSVFYEEISANRTEERYAELQMQLEDAQAGLKLARERWRNARDLVEHRRATWKAIEAAATAASTEKGPYR